VTVGDLRSRVEGAAQQRRCSARCRAAKSGRAQAPGPDCRAAVVPPGQAPGFWWTRQHGSSILTRRWAPVKQVGRRKSIRPRGRGGGNPADLVPPPATHHRLAPRAGAHETEIQRLLGHKALSMLDRHIEWKSSGPDGAGCPAEHKRDTRVFPEQTASTRDGRRRSPSEEFVEAKAWRRIGPGGPPGLQNQRGA